MNKNKKKYIVKKKFVVCGNGIAEIDERYKKKYAYSYSFSIFFTETIWFVAFFYDKKKKSEMELWQWHCQIGGKKIYFSWFLAIPLPKLREKKKTCGNEFVAMALPK